MRLTGVQETIEANDANLSGSTFSNVNLSAAAFDNVDLSKVTFHNINFARSTVADANLTGVSFALCNWVNAQIDGVPVTDLLAAYWERRG